MNDIPQKLHRDSPELKIATGVEVFNTLTNGGLSPGQFLEISGRYLEDAHAFILGVLRSVPVTEDAKKMGVSASM